MSLDLGGDPHLCWVFPNSLKNDVLTRFHQLKPSNISCFEVLSTEFIRNYSLLVEEPMMMYHLFKVIGKPHETFKSYVVRFETILRTIIDPKRHLALNAFKQGLLIAQNPLKDHLVIFNLILDSIKTYQDAIVLIVHNVQIEKAKKLCSVAFEQS